MTQSTELKTSTGQRVGIIIVALILLGSTIALYAGIVLSYNKDSSSTLADSDKEERFYELYEEYSQEVSAQAAVLSTEYFDTFAPYKSRVKSFNAAAITEVTYTDLVIGTGEEVVEEFYDYSAYYIGFLSDETIFDSSFNDSSNPTALTSPLSGGQMIEGWNQGIIGMKLGGIREISIPSDLAYGDTENGSIPASSPLKFVIMLIPQIEEIDWPDEMYELYYDLYYSE